MTARVTSIPDITMPGRTLHRIIGETADEVQAEITRLMNKAEESGAAIAQFTHPARHPTGIGYASNGHVVLFKREAVA